MTDKNIVTAEGWLREFLPYNARRVAIGNDFYTENYIIRAVFDVGDRELIIISHLSDITDKRIIELASRSIIEEYESVVSGKTQAMTAHLECT